MSKVEMRQRAAIKGQRSAGKDKKRGPPLCMGLGGALV